MTNQWQRRQFLSVIGAGVAAAACSTSCSPQGELDLPPGGSIARRRLGRTGVQVSMIGLGGFHIGVPEDEQEGIRLVRLALDHGIDFLDNCWDYHMGESERRMGKALRDGYRQKAFLMTKIDGRTRAAAAGQIDQSLSRLQTDVIDLLQIHEVIRLEDAARVFAPDGAIEALLAAKQAGKIRFIGFTGHKDPLIHLAMLQAAQDHGFVFDTVQMPLNVMDVHYRSFENEVLPDLLQRDIGVLGMKALGGGAVLESGVVTARECLRYALSLPASVVITGCDSVAVLEQALDVAMRFHPLAPAERAALLARTAPFGKGGTYELSKTTEHFDSTTQNPHWLEEARL